MAFYVGDVITQGFYTGVAGEVFACVSRNPSGATFLSSSNITDLGGGDYLLSFTASAAGNYYGRLIGAVSGEVIKGNWTANTADGMTPARAAKLDSLGAGSVTSTGPVSAGGDVSITAGDSYLNADGRAMPWTNAAWPSFTSATATMTVKDRTGATVLSKAVSLDSATSIHVDLTATDTNLSSDSYRFAIVATLADGSPATLVSGGFSVTKAGA